MELRRQLYYNILREEHYLITNGRYSYGDIEDMSPDERGAFLNLLIADIKEKNEAIESQQKRIK